MQQYRLTINALQKANAILATGNLQALIAFLQKYKLNEYQQDFIALQAKWNDFHKKEIAHLIDREDTRKAHFYDSFSKLLNLLETNDSLPSSFHLPPKNTALPLAKGVLLGREKELTAIHEALQQDNAFVMVQGFGGLGKSTVLLHYCYMDKYEAEYPEKLWIRVWDGEKGIQNALVAYFRPRIDIQETDIDTAFTRVLTHLQAYPKGCLLILDNANESEDLLTCVAPLQATKWKVLVSTRCETEHIPTVAIKPVSLQAAQEIFLFYLGNKTAFVEQCRKDADLPKLLKQVERHTLVIEILAKTLIKNPAVSLKSLLNATERNDFQAKPFDTKLHNIAHQQHSALSQHELRAAQYLCQIFSLSALNEAEQQILLYFSILPAQPYPFTAENRNFEALHENPICLLNLFDVEEIEEAETALAETLMALVAKGFLQDEGLHSYYCHPVLHYVIHQHTQPTAENCEAVLRGLFKTIKWDSYTNQIALADRLPLVENVLTHIQADTKTISDIYNNSASIYQAFGNYTKALDYHKENVRIKEKLLSHEDHDLATAYSNIAITYENLGDYNKALEYALKAIAICEKVLAAEHPDLATSYNNIAITYKNLGDYSKALEYALKDIAIREKVFAVDHPSLATSYNNIAITYKNLGDYDKALEYALKAIAIREKVLAAEHPDLATSYGNIAITYKNLGDYPKALEYALKAIAIREKVLAAEHPDLAQSYHNISFIYTYLQKWELALANAKKAIEIWIKTLPNEHPYIKKAIDNMRNILTSATKAEGEEKYAAYRAWFEGL